MTNTTNTSGNTEQSEKPKAILSVADLEMRDYFAAKAMQGDLASWPGTIEAADYANQIGERAYLIADAMLRAREK